MQNDLIEKIVLGIGSARPQDKVHSSFCQKYLNVNDPYALGKRIFGDKNVPKCETDDDWQILFTYGAGYQGGGIYDWFAGFLLSSPEHGFNFLISNNFGRGISGNFGMSDAYLGLGMSSELESFQGLDINFDLHGDEILQIESVIKSWHELFELDENEEGDESINILTGNKKLPQSFKKNNGTCYTSGPESDWEDGIGIFSDYWSLIAKFRSD